MKTVKLIMPTLQVTPLPCRVASSVLEGNDGEQGEN
jgi:hypothetical protein